ncbi:hypothetical protein CC77DRAFT_1082505 [Alternaria alternata]|uniref:Uncharacterized protein n=1 Tax=Alternaria alternata TaxID=5599 RepID=A0A177D5D8_ALTAL|nr:hypothetical protein CC77DRAFT_1082505 [Alternaria alternata]OAG14621.1 hypothetical protein CC77DRAFT_1082505 [Alternaria alternata]
MPSLLRNTLDHAFVRSKRPGDVKVHREKESSRGSASSLAPHERILHYVGKGRTYVCRCTNPRRHSVRISCVAFESRHLSADLTLYLERHDLQSCAVADLQDYHEWQDAKWEVEEVYADEFHYANRNKDVVCRCLQPWSHDYGTPRHPEIIERCAEFFCAHTGELTATKKQWKSFDNSSPPPYSFIVRDQPGHPRTYQDSGKKHRPTISPEVKVRDKIERKASVMPEHRGHVSIQEATPEREPGMLSQAWQTAHPSLSKARPGAESAYSTPMGTVPPSRSASPSVALNMTQCASSSASSSQSQGEADTADDYGTTTRREPLPFDNGLWYRDRLHYEKYGDMASQISVEELFARSLPVELPGFGRDEGNQTPVAELTDCRSPVELPATPVRRRHTATLKKLKGREWDTASELEAKHSRLRHEQTINGTFDYARKTARLSSPFE